MKSFFKRHWGRRGQAMMELALVLPLLILITMGIFDFARVMFAYAHASHALRQALRYGAILGDGHNGIAQYADCQGMIEIGKNVLFVSEMPAVTVTYLDKNDESVLTVTRNSTTIPMTCADHAPGNPLPEDIEAATENGDLIRIDTNATVDLVTPILPSTTFEVRLTGRRTLIKNVQLEEPAFCGDDICQVSNGEDTSTCACDCLVGGTCVYGAIPAVSIVSPTDGETGLNNTEPVYVTAHDPETTPQQLVVTIRLTNVASGGVVTYPAALDPNVPTTYVFRWDTRAFTNGTYQLQASATDRHGNTTISDPISVIVNNLASCGNGVFEPSLGEDTTTCWPDAAVINNFRVEVTSDCANLDRGLRHVDLAWDSVPGAVEYRLYAQCAPADQPSATLCNPSTGFSYTLIHSTAQAACSGLALDPATGMYLPYKPVCFSPSAFDLWYNTAASLSNIESALGYKIVAVNASGDIGPTSMLLHRCGP